MEDERILLERQFAWVEYWMMVIQQQQDSDWEARTSDGVTDEPLYRDDADRAINSMLVNLLLAQLTHLGATIKDRLDSLTE